jgi:hypothetical protein
MKRTGIIPAAAAMVSSLVTLGCCLPVGSLGAVGLAGLAVFVSGARPWLLAGSAALLGFGFWQTHRAASCGIRPSRIALALLFLAALVLIALVLFPQVIAGWMADLAAPRTR